MAKLDTLSPLAYIRAGAELRELGVIEEVTDLETLVSAFMHYLKFMERRLASYKSETRPIPLTWEGFRVFSGCTAQKYEELTSPPDGALVHSLISDCINGQWAEGAVTGLFSAKAMQLIGGFKEKVEVSGAVAIEQITGMEVV